MATLTETPHTDRPNGGEGKEISGIWNQLLGVLNSDGASCKRPIAVDGRIHTVNITDTIWHQGTTAYLSALIARHLKLSKADTAATVCAALVHDIGKFRLDPEMVYVPGSFTPEQRAAMQAHPVIGAERVRTLLTGKWGDRIATIVAQHHEKMDGSGYPHELQGKDIHIGARIISVADVYDALTSHRCYQNGRTPSGDESFNFLTHNTGTHFDSDVVKAFGAARAEVSGHARNNRNLSPIERLIQKSFAVLQPA